MDLYTVDDRVLDEASVRSFGDHIQYLKDNFTALVQYRERTGTLDESILNIKKALFHEDPFVVFDVSLVATLVLGDKYNFH